MHIIINKLIFNQMMSLMQVSLEAKTTQKLFDHGNVCLGGQDITFITEKECKIQGKIFLFKQEEIILKQTQPLDFNIDSRNSIKRPIVYSASNGEEDDKDKNNYIVWLI